MPTYYKHRTIFAKGKLITEIVPNKVVTKDFMDMMEYAKEHLFYHKYVVCNAKSVVFQHPNKNNKLDAIEFMRLYKQSYLH